MPDPNHYSTAHDLARIAAYGYTNPKFAEIVGTGRKDILRNNQPETLYNENKLLSAYRGANGVKTGYTDAAGRCLIAAAKRGNIQLITVVLDADSMWEDSMALLDLGFNQLQEKAIVHSGDLVDAVQVANGRTDVTYAVIRDDVVVPVSQTSRDEFRTVFEISKLLVRRLLPAKKLVQQR